MKAYTSRAILRKSGTRARPSRRIQQLKALYPKLLDRYHESEAIKSFATDTLSDAKASLAQKIEAAILVMWSHFSRSLLSWCGSIKEHASWPEFVCAYVGCIACERIFSESLSAKLRTQFPPEPHPQFHGGHCYTPQERERYGLHGQG